MNALKQNIHRMLALVAGTSLIINLLWLGPALFSMQVFDRVLTSRSRDTLLMLLLGVVCAFAMVGLLDYLRGRFQAVMGGLINDTLAPEITRSTLVEAAKRQGPMSMEALRDVTRLRNLFATPALVAVMDAPWAVIYLAVITVAHPVLGAASLAAALVMVALALANDKMSKGSLEAVQRESSRSQSFLDQTMQNAEVAQVLGMGGSLIRRWRLMSARLGIVQKPVGRQTLAMSTFTRILRQAIQVLLQALGAYLVLVGEASPGVLIASTMLLGRALQPIEQIVGSWKVLAEGRLAYQRLLPVLDAKASSEPPMDLPPPVGKLVASGLIYRPPGSERMILNGISMQLEAGESVAILGPSGAGKSTLARVLTGLWAPNAGTVRLDGADLSKWNREAIGPYVGYVPQDVELFAGTVAENISRMGPVNSAMVVAAAKQAGVHELILALPEGYDTVIDPHAALMSPGQRQRLALARALYGEPKLLIMDEPNSNLDGIGEMALAQTLAQLKGKATVVLVTHRTALTAHVDKILIVEGGRATQFGPAQEVLQSLRGGAPAAAAPASQAPSRPAEPSTRKPEITAGVPA